MQTGTCVEGKWWLPALVRGSFHFKRPARGRVCPCGQDQVPTYTRKPDFSRPPAVDTDLKL